MPETTPLDRTRRSAPRARLALAGLTVALTLAGCSPPGGGDDPDGSSVAPAPTTSPPSAAPPTRSGVARTPAEGPHDDADAMFATMMIPHHRQAVEISDVLLTKSGVDAQVRELATTIRDAQSPEIEQMSGWVTGWGGDPSAPPMAMGDDGMLTREQLDALEKADGAVAQRLFLEGMIGHHQGAVSMARDELQQGTNPDARQLARSIVGSQTSEIERMRALVGTAPSPTPS